MVAKEKDLRRINITDLIFTIILIGFQLTGIIFSITLLLGPDICDGPCQGPSTVRDFNYYLPHIIINSVYTLTFVGAGIFSILRLRARKSAFWLSLIAIGINIITLLTVVLITATVGKFQ